VAPSQSLYEQTRGLVRARLLEAHRLPLGDADFAWIDHAFRAFFTAGPDIHYARGPAASGSDPSYRTLMTAADISGENRTFLSSEARFGYVRNLQLTNRIVPVVGNFAGPDALRRIGDYVRGRHAVVRAFYGSNVEVYLTRSQRAAYCFNLAALPYVSSTLYVG